MHSIVIASDVSFELSNGRSLFQHLHFSLEPKLTALVGANGIGKTCLAKLLAGELQPTCGVIRRNGWVTYLPQKVVPPLLSIDDFLSIEYKWSLLGEQLLDGLDRQSLCTNLSGGEWMRVRLAQVLSKDFLILDEPTNDLDREGRQSLLGFLRRHHGGALLISHDRECLQLCDEIFELTNQGLSKYGGGWENYEAAKNQERDGLSAALDAAKRARDETRLARTEQKLRQEKRNRRGAEAAARGGMPKILIGARKRRAQATTGKIDVDTFERANEAVREVFEAYSSLKTDPVMYADLLASEIPEGKLVADARAFNIRFGDWSYRKDLNFSWRGNIRLALKGLNGSGKSTLIKALLGSKFETRGELRSGGLRTLYLDQRCAILDETKSILENVRDVSALDESQIRNALARFLFTKESVFQEVSSLSGGERLRAALAKGLLGSEKPELLILDEPTNNLDLANIEFLEELVSSFRGALIVISHDEIFLRNCGLTNELEVNHVDL
jgi:ATPase subunit of ABC transporter with duplicated ATPase domains